MSEEIKVSVVEFTDRKFYLLQWIDPNSGRKKTESSKIERGGQAQYDKAVKKAGEREAELKAGTYHAPSKIAWDAFRQRYEDEVLASLKDTTGHKVDGIFNTIEEILNPKRLADLNEARLSYYQKTLRDMGRSEQTIKGHLCHLKAALNWAVGQKIISKAPKMEMPKRAKSITGRTPMKGRAITLEEFERMTGKIAAAFTPAASKRNPHPKPPSEAVVASWQYYMQGLWVSGLRLAESLELFWEDESRDDRLAVVLDGDESVLRIPAGMEKGNRDRELPITPDFAEFLQQTPPEKRKGRVFNPLPFRQNGRTDRLQPHQVGESIAKIGEAAGVKVRTETKRAKDGKTIEVVKYGSAHDFRRAFGERWSKRVEAVVLMELMRHESIETTLRYYVGRNARKTCRMLWRQHRQNPSNTFGNSSQKEASRNEATPSVSDDCERG